MQKKIEQKLRAAFQNQPQPEYTKDHLDETIAKTHMAYRNAYRPPVPLIAFVKRQARYLGASIWGAQSLLTILACLFFHSLLRDSPSPALARYLPVLLGWFSTLLAVVSAPLFFRAMKYRMLELELSTQSSLPQIILSHTILVALGDVVALILVLAVVGRRGIDIPQSLAYLLLPLLVTSSGVFHILGRHSIVACAGYCIGVMLLFGALFLFVDGVVFVWGTLCILAIPICVVLFQNMLRRMRVWDDITLEGI